MKKAFILFAVLFLTIPCFATDTIFLKSGQKVSGKILEKTDEKVRIEVGGVALTYWPESIDRVIVEEEVAAQPKEEKVSVPAEDGAKLYKEAFQKVKEPPARGDLQIHQIVLDLPQKGWPDDARLILLLNDNREAINLFKKATLQSSDGYILGKLEQDSNPSKNIMKNYFNYLTLLNLDLIETNESLFKKDYPSAQESYLATVRFVKHLSEQKEGATLGSVFVLIAENKIEPFIVQSLEKSGLEGLYYKDLLQSLLAFPSDEKLARNWLEGESAYGLIYYRYQLENAKIKGMVDQKFVSEYTLTYEKESRKFVEYELNAIKMKNSGLDSPIPEKVLSEIKGNKKSDCKPDINADSTFTDKYVACWMKDIQEIGMENEIKGQLAAKVSLPYWRKSAEAYYSHLVKRNNFIIATAIKLYNLDKGHLPEKLDDLVPEYLTKVPEDAFDNFKSIKYLKKPNGYLVYSIGPDRVDQKGDVVCDFVGGPQACDIAMFVKQ